MLKHQALVLLALLYTGVAMAVEEPEYIVIEKSGDLELRTYRPMVVAETIVSGSLDQASSKGFKIIADYIFGNNRARTSNARTDNNEKISMTAPVTLSPVKLRTITNGKMKSDVISTANPVITEATDGQWRMHFVMPKEYTIDTLPTPNNPAVTLREIPECQFAVIRFSGFTGEVKVAKKTAELMAWLNSKGLEPRGSAQIARYNPPWTFPFLRRNEIMVPY